MDIQLAKQVVADTLRTMMGATAADPYVKAIERALDDAAITPEMVRNRLQDIRLEHDESATD